MCLSHAVLATPPPIRDTDDAKAFSAALDAMARRPSWTLRGVLKQVSSVLVLCYRCLDVCVQQGHKSFGPANEQRPVSPTLEKGRYAFDGGTNIDSAL